MTGKEAPAAVTRRANIQEVALKCGVHASTVSSVLTGKSKQRRISSDLTARILAAAAELDYSPNLLVRSVLGGKTDTLSFFNAFREHRRSDIYMDALKVAIERSAGEFGYDLTISCDFGRTSTDTYRHLNGGRSDGLIFFKPADGDPLLSYLRKSRMPLVLLNTADAQGVLSSVCEDQEQGVQLIAENLLAAGHRRIAMITQEKFVDAELRVRRLREILRAAGVEVPDEWVVNRDAPSPLAFMESAAPPTALFCWRDQAGYQILDRCSHAGIRVPEDVSVIGYDGLPWPTTTEHTLASVIVDLDALGRMAVETLDQLVKGAESAPIVRNLAVRFDPGTTFAPPRGQRRVLS